MTSMYVMHSKNVLQQLAVTLAISCPLFIWNMNSTGGQFLNIEHLKKKLDLTKIQEKEKLPKYSSKYTGPHIIP